MSRTNPSHNSLRVILSVPADEKTTSLCNMGKIFQVLYYPDKDHRKTPRNFSFLSTGSLQLCYAFHFCISLYFSFFPISFKLLPLCTSELCWSQRSNRLKTCVQVKWLDLWPQAILPWEHLICSNPMYFYFNGMLFAWGKPCGSPSAVFSFYHFVEKCINPFCFTSGIFLTQPWDFPLYLQHYPWLLCEKPKRSNMKLNGPKRCVKNKSWSQLQRAKVFSILGLYISIYGRSYICSEDDDMCYARVQMMWKFGL